MSRDRGIDGLRAYAIGGVVLGHWLVTALVLTPAGTLTQASPLASMPALVPVTWLLQTLGLFFFTGGYASARSLDSSRPDNDARGGYRLWYGRRLGRLVGPVGVLLGCWGGVLAVAVVGGVPVGTLRTVATLVVSPLWFLLPFVALALLTRPLRGALRRVGVLGVVLPAVVLVAVVDLTGRVRPGGVPGWVVPLGVVAAWLVPYAIGVALAGGEPRDRRTGTRLVVGGVAGMAALVLVAGYPASAVGVPGAGRSNLDPPSLFTVCLALAQVGCALLLRPGLARLLERPRWSTPVLAVNGAAMSVYLWHQTALVTVTVLGARLSGGAALTGLHTVPDRPLWVVARLAWLPLFATVLALLVSRRPDRPARSQRPRGQAVQGGYGPDDRRNSSQRGAGVRSLRSGPVRQVEVIAVRSSDPPSRGRAARQSR
ncbi:acyltransferase family protein [Micromonospora sp. NBC_01796]|uniref:acyltransferase family protein n=1 Tax=Micromonospora sp. NBC_01796 TaxID=2975987 RepID=UPI002DD8425C|nr:acyltransferase [Micromonospora sp. NBC_01796]WSA83679.1 acyltransferase [Micromonospora sp. NBC_01796]